VCGGSSSSSSSLYSVFSSIGGSNFIFRYSDSRSSLSNESMDDNKKRRGGGLVTGIVAQCGETTFYVFSA